MSPEKIPKVIRLIGKVIIRTIVPRNRFTADKITEKMRAEIKVFSPVIWIHRKLPPYVAAK